jgi:DNA-binding transcriptional regulator YbjK
MASTDTVRRRPRGERRRQEILRAALDVIRERGVGGITHRAVAEAAGVPTATTTYYFASIDELLEDALRLFVDEEVERLDALAERLREAQAAPSTVATLVVAELAGVDPDGNIAQFELYLEASRRPGLHDAAAACLDAYATAAEVALRTAGATRPAEGARAFVALIDGFALARIASGRRESREDLAGALLDLFIAFAMDADERAAWRRRLDTPSA